MLVGAAAYLFIGILGRRPPGGPPLPIPYAIPTPPGGPPLFTANPPNGLLLTVYYCYCDACGGLP